MPMPFTPKKSLGQNFLTSDVIPKKLCAAADIKPGELVLEIGPGTGQLTKELLSQGAKVIAVEADERAITALEETFTDEIAHESLILHSQDARRLDVAALGLENQAFKVVANIPYYLSGLLLRTLLDNEIQPSKLVFLMQKELVHRIARAEKESLLSLSVKVFGTPTYVTTVKRGHFNPPPKVDSAILKVSDISKTRLLSYSSSDFFALLHLAFGQKRKQLQRNLRQQYPASLIEAAFAACAVGDKVRAEDLNLDTWGCLASHFLSPTYPHK